MSTVAAARKKAPQYASLPSQTTTTTSRNDDDNDEEHGYNHDEDSFPEEEEPNDNNNNNNTSSKQQQQQQQQATTTKKNAKNHPQTQKQRQALLELRDAMDALPSQPMSLGTDHHSSSSDAVMGGWCGVMVLLGVLVVGMFWYWTILLTNHHHHQNNTTSLWTPDNNNNRDGPVVITAHRTRPPRPSTTNDNDNDDDDDDDTAVVPVAPGSSRDPKGLFYFDPFAAVQTSNPLDIMMSSSSSSTSMSGVTDYYYAQPWVPPVWNNNHPHDDNNNNNNNNNDSQDRLGYMMEPDIVNNTIVFVSEGDLYITTWWSPSSSLPPSSSSSGGGSLPAMKLTTTVGNVRDPKLHPQYPYLVAYTATYTGRRDVYVLDLRRRTHGNQPALRLTYWPNSVGVRGLVGWKDGSNTLVFQAMSNEVSLPDPRLYELTLALEDTNTTNKDDDATNKENNNSNNNAGNPTIRHPQILQTNPIPLSQALEGAYHDHEDCWYFTRFQQSSHTARYQGGTAESIWAWCTDHLLAVPLTTHQFNGTSKAPSILGFYDSQNPAQKYHYLLFLSDRGENLGTRNPDDPNQWKATSMNLWAMPLPEKEDLAASVPPTSAKDKLPLVVPSFNPSHFVQLTHVSCDFGGFALREYSLDPITQHVVLRIGADLHFLSAEVIQQKLEHAARQHRFLENATITEQPEESKPPVAKSAESTTNNNNNDNGEIQKLPILVYSDFHEHQERLIPLEFPDDMNSGDVYKTGFGSLAFLMSARGQAWVAPVLPEAVESSFTGHGRNIPQRRYRIAPGSQMGGSVRILTVRHVPLLMEDATFSRRLAVILATDPRSPTAEHAFYLIETQSDASPTFISFEDLPDPFLGGHKGGGSVQNGGLGSVIASSVRVSPCGRRLHWTDTDGRICVMTLPLYKAKESEYSDYIVLPKENERGEPMIGAEAELTWSPGGRYLAVEHNARNQFTIISIVDCGDPLMAASVSTRGLGEKADSNAAGIKIGRIVQATPARFNSYSPYWGMSSFDHSYYSKAEKLAETYNDDPEAKLATTTLYFLTDRDIVNKQRSPWGTRAPNPYFERTSIVYALPLLPQEHEHATMSGHFSGGGAMELYVEEILDLNSLIKDEKRSLSTSPSQAPTVEDPEEHFPQDPDIEFGPADLTFARSAYRLANIPESTYSTILSQAKDDGSLLLIERKELGFYVKLALVIDFPSDKVEMKEVSLKLDDYGLSTNRDYVFISSTQEIQVIPNSVAGFMSLTSIDADEKENVVQTEGVVASVWPSLEYQHLYGDAWRLMRDYFYDKDMTGIDWEQVFERFLPLVRRCAKREELDDVLVQMASEVSALHVFVYGGEYNTPLLNDPAKDAHIPASFGIALQRSAEWKGYVITSLPELDPDFGLEAKTGIYSPLSHRTLRMSGQKGLKVGDVIVGVNGESVMLAPDFHFLLRGLAHESVRLDVLRLADAKDATNSILPEPVIAVPIGEPGELLYSAWEWKSRQLAKDLAANNGFSVGYIHLRSMGKSDSDAFYRHFFPDYDKEALIVDVRHNRGGNIDWWLLDVLQRKAWMYWQGRSQNATTGGLGWDEQFAFRGHIVVLIDEKTSSDGEGFSRGMSELGLGRLIGTRTWGGGIWLSSDNTLVDGGIATAPEDGTYNEKFGPGLGIEQMGVEPDIVVDNNPRPTYDGKDTQLEHAIDVLKEWLKEEPVVVPKTPAHKRNMAYDDTESCKAKP